MFQAIEKGGETLKYVTPELARRYRNADALAGSIMDRETSIIAAGVTDFSFMNGRAGIRLQYFALIFSEGSLLVREKSASFRRSGGEWRVASFV